jgi:DNA transformation protein and related proteins
VFHLCIRFDKVSSILSGLEENEQVKSNPYVEFLLEQFEPLGEIRVKAMFGGYGLYCDEVFFALVANNAVFLKADDVNRPQFEAAGLKAFRPYEDRPDTMQYYQAPAEMFEDPEALKGWVGGAIAAGVRAQAKKKPKKRR